MSVVTHRSRTLAAAAIALVAVALGGWKVGSVEDPGARVGEATVAFVDSLSDEQKKKAVYAYDGPERTTWAFVPLDTRKGLQLRDMDDAQRKLAFALLDTTVSGTGRTKAVQIMKLETLLDAMQASDTPLRDSLRYYFAVYGDPKTDAKWGLSIEGHHLSLNFTIEGGKLSATTPTFYATNPAIIPDDLPKEIETPFAPNTRVLGPEDAFALTLRQTLTEEQAKAATIAEEALKELRGPNGAQPPVEAPQGIAVSELDDSQRGLLKQLVEVYATNVPEAIAQARMESVEQGGWEKVRFGWAGATLQGEPHYYRIQGPTFLIEFVNTQPDVAGNPANHIHCVWRDMRGDFGLPLAGK